MKPDAFIKVRFFRADEGGRKTSTPPNFFGCLMEIGGHLYDCRLILERVGSIRPGAECDVPVKFLDFDLVKEHLAPGVQFQLFDGHPVASGVIVSLANE